MLHLVALCSKCTVITVQQVILEKDVIEAVKQYIDDTQVP